MKRTLTLLFVLSFFTCTISAADNQIQTPDNLALKAICEGKYKKFCKLVESHSLHQNILNVALHIFFDIRAWHKPFDTECAYRDSFKDPFKHAAILGRLAYPRVSHHDIYERFEYVEKVNKQAPWRARIARKALEKGANPDAYLAPTCGGRPYYAEPPRCFMFLCFGDNQSEIILYEPYLSVFHALRKRGVNVGIHRELAPYFYILVGQYLDRQRFEKSEYAHVSDRLHASDLTQQAQDLNASHCKYLKTLIRLNPQIDSGSGNIAGFINTLKEEIAVESRPYCVLAYLLHQSNASVGFEETSTHTDLPPALPMILHATQERE